MKKLVLVSAVASALAIPALAQAAEESAHTVSANVGVFSNYIFRGVTQTSEELALQGGIDYSHASGLYLGTWGSNISWLNDAGSYGYTASSLELDLYGGYKGTFAKDFAFDVGAIYYYYPGEQARGFVSPNTTEIYGALSWKWLSAKLSYSLSEYFANMDSEGTYYFDVSANIPVADTGLTVLAHAGYLNVAGTPGGVSNDDLYGYTDWKLGVSYALPKNVTVGAYYTDTNAEEIPYTFGGINWADKQMAVYLQRTF